MAHERNAWIESHSSNADDPLAVYATDFLNAEA
jgi:hypothetical protein